MKIKVAEEFDISQYITAADIVSAVTAGVIAYIRNKPKPDKKKQQQEAPGADEQPTTPSGGEKTFPSKLTNDEVAAIVKPKPGGGMDFGSIGEYYEGEAFEKYCAAKGIQCSSALSQHMFGLHSRWFMYSKMDFDSLLNNPQTMSVLNNLAKAGGSDQLRVWFQSSFWEKLSNMSADQINQICAGSNPMQGLLDAAYGKMAIGKLMDVGEAELRVCLGQISKMPIWHVGDGMMKLGRTAAGELVAYGKFNPL